LSTWPSSRLRVAAPLGAAAVALAACSPSAAAHSAPPSTNPPATTTRASTTTTKPPGKPAPLPRKLPRIDDGSLGDRATRLACKLLSRAQIAAQFGGPVGPATPTYPYCQWTVGSSAFVALQVEPGVAYATATRFVVPLQTVAHLGRAAEIANNRYLYFAGAHATYWLLYQQVGDFSSLHTARLTALARDVLARPLPAGKLPAPAAVAPGPPVYFAGDSTAAGPEWAWATYFATSARERTFCEYQVSSGMLVPKFFDWAKHILAVAAARRPRLVIWMGSANDGQPLLVKGSVAGVGTQAWQKAYGAVVGSVMAGLLREGAKVLWIGEPAMANPGLSLAMRSVDEVYAAQARRHPGVYWFDPGKVLDGPGGAYRGSIVIGGRPTQVRLDGIHLNAAGSIYLDRFIAKIVSRLLAPAPAKH
jgi:hypothetical protein